MTCSFTSGAVFGVVGMLMSAAMMYYTVQTIRNFRETAEVSIALSFPHRKATVAVYVLLASFIIYSLGMAAGAGGLIYDACQPLDMVSKLGGGVALLGLVYFLWTMEDITSQS